MRLSPDETEGSHRRVHFGDVDAHRIKRNRERRKWLDDLTKRISEAGKGTKRDLIGIHFHISPSGVVRAGQGRPALPFRISAVVEAVRLARAELKKPNRPMSVFLFVGPSGTGKTELAKALAENLFHDERRLIRFDMSECMEAVELILREGFSKEYGARNLERTMDRLIGTLVAEALLSGKITAGQALKLAAVDGRIQFCEGFSL